MLGYGRPSHPDAVPHSARCCNLLPPRARAARSLAPRSCPSRAPPTPLAPRSSLSYPSRAPPTPRSSLRPCATPPAPSRSARRPPGRAKAGTAGARVPLLVLALVVLARRHSPPDPSPTTGIDWPRPSPPRCCKCMFQVFQMF
jgi:hypothetical protein